VHRRLEKSHQEFLKERQEQIFNIDEGEITSENRPDPEKLKAGLKIMEYVDPQMQEEALDILNNITFTGNRVARMEEAKSELEITGQITRASANTGLTRRNTSAMWELLQSS